MRLLLERRYFPKATFGRLLLGKKVLCLVREAPKACFGGSQNCLPEGIYELVPEHSESEGWKIRVGEDSCFLNRGPAYLPRSGELCPFTFLKNGTELMFTRLAFMKLIEALTPYWEAGEIVELQVIGKGVHYRRESCLMQQWS